MNALHDQRRPRKSRPGLEQLDSRIAPAVIGATALAAELRVEARQVDRWEASLPNAQAGSDKKAFLINHVDRTEGRMAVQEARLARIEARSSGATMFPAPVTVTPPVGNTAPVSNAAGTPTGPITGPSPRPGHPHPIIATNPVTFAISPPVSTSPGSGSTGTTTTASGSTSSLPANVSQTLDVIYNAYEQDPSAFPASLPTTDAANTVQIQGTNVGIQVHDGNPADFSTLVSALQSAGMQITISSAQYGTAVGFLPIAQLPTVAALSDAPSVTPLFQAIMH
jgi:hypothetical protein